MILLEQESMESLFTPLVQINFILFIACSKLGSEVKTGERMMEGKFIADHVSEEYFYAYLTPSKMLGAW